MSKMKTVSLGLTLALGPGLFLAGCSRAPSGGAADATPPSAARAARSGGKGVAAALLTKEEVAAVLGKPVTTIEGTGTNLTYKTDVMFLETSIEVERHDDVADAVQSMQGARTATGFLGGKPQVVPGLGDEAFFGAMSFLYVRKGDTFITITPPNLLQMAEMKSSEEVREAKLGSEEQVKALERLKEISKNDPSSAGLKKPDAMQGAVAVVKASSQKQGTEYEAQARAMALALAAKLMEKL
jgi:hypothetical protein